jgi:hypothetical protein
VAALRILLVVIFVVIATYTAFVVADHGMNLFAVFFGDMARLGWPGQFNLDFMCMLILSGLWVAWRHEFSGPGLALAVLASLGGATFLSVYLFVVTGQAKGDMRVVLLGHHRAGVTD